MSSHNTSEWLTRLNGWGLTRMPWLNREILAGRSDRGQFAADLQLVLDQAPAASLLTPGQAQQCVVILGLAGASLGRHYQEERPEHRMAPAAAFEQLRAPLAQMPFVTYFSSVAVRTGTGHASRDTYASLIRWNLPPCEVWWDGVCLIRLDSVFDDGRVRTYTGAADEERFFGLLKASEAIERSVNVLLEPIAASVVDVESMQARLAIRRATRLMDHLRAVNQEFTNRGRDDGLRVDYFMDVFRQFAIHWVPGDVPPSGALDVESLVRDLLLGLAVPDYEGHLRSLYPVLLEEERARLTALSRGPSLPGLALGAAGVSATELVRLSAAGIRDLVDAHPVLVDLYGLLAAQARVGGVHLRMTKRFLFDPQRARDDAGLGDPGVVSNRRGTTGMDELHLQSLTRTRQHHLLAPLRPAAQALLRPSRPSAPEAPGHPVPRPGQAGAGADQQAGPTVRFVGTDLPDLGVTPR